MQMSESLLQTFPKQKHVFYTVAVLRHFLPPAPRHLLHLNIADIFKCADPIFSTFSAVHVWKRLYRQWGLFSQHANTTHNVMTLLLRLFFRESVIDKRIESAVSQMQSVIELGRVIRDRKTLPVKVNHQFYLIHSYTAVLIKTTGNNFYNFQTYVYIYYALWHGL